MRIAIALSSLILAACSSSDAPAPANSQPDTTPATTNAAPAAASAVFGESSQGELVRYEIVAQQLSEDIAAGRPLEELISPFEELVGIGTVLLPEFTQARPDCGEYLKKAAQLDFTWFDMTAEQIEAGYHKDEALPKIENGAACYHIKDLIVHPISARAILTEDSSKRAEAKHEIDEVIAHLAVVRALTR